MPDQQRTHTTVWIALVGRLLSLTGLRHLMSPQNVLDVSLGCNSIQLTPPNPSQGHIYTSEDTKGTPPFTLFPLPVSLPGFLLLSFSLLLFPFLVWLSFIFILAGYLLTFFACFFFYCLLVVLFIFVSPLNLLLPCINLPFPAFAFIVISYMCTS